MVLQTIRLKSPELSRLNVCCFSDCAVLTDGLEYGKMVCLGMFGMNDGLPDKRIMEVDDMAP